MKNDYNNYLDKRILDKCKINVGQIITPKEVCQISDKYIEIESLKNELTEQLNSKEAEIIQSRNEIEAKNKEIEAIGLKVSSLEEYIEEAKGAPQVVERIREVMAHKGFLSDKELEDILSEY